MRPEDNNENDGISIRVFAMVIGGICVMILIPFFSIWFSTNVNELLDFPDIVIFPYNIVISFILLGIGLFWAVWSNIVLFKIGKGSSIPTKLTQTKKLVIKGPYKYSRNPMVFGYILFLIGLGFLFNLLFLIIVFPPLISILLLVYIKGREEKDLVKRFGESYRNYKKKVSVIIPLPPKKLKD
ncbi:MAG: methyltransferase family protein [Promethearchaeota archaeon]